MKYRRLGKSNLEVSAIGLGCMPLSISPQRPTEEHAIRVIHAAIDLGITLIDTADAYCIDDTEPGHNERLIGKALAQLPPARREKLVVATKGGLVRPGGRWERDGRPEHLRKVCEQSLLNLGVDRITLYQYHRIDPNVSLEASMGELKRLQEEGKIQYIGVSNFSVMEMETAAQTAAFVSLQNEYSRQHRAPETDGTLRYTRDNDLAFLAWSPLNGIGGAKNLGRRHPFLESVAEAHGVSPHRAALAWLMGRGPQVIPIPGATRIESVRDNVEAVNLVLRSEELEELNRPKS